MTRLELMTEEQVAEWLDVSVKTVADWRAKRINLPFIRVSDRKVRYDRSQVEAFLKSREVEVA